LIQEELKCYMKETNDVFDSASSFINQVSAREDKPYLKICQFSKALRINNLITNSYSKVSFRKTLPSILENYIKLH